MVIEHMQLTQCVLFNTQIDVAVEGLSAVILQGRVNGDGFPEESVAKQCLEKLGGGLSIAQLRWVYSSFSDDELVEDGWDFSSVANLDGNSSSHKWSELSEACAAEEIFIGGPPIDSTAAELFKELIFGQSSSETFDVSRLGSFFAPANKSELADFLESNGSAIAYFDVGYILTDLDLDTLELVDVVVPQDLEGEPRLYHASAVSLQDGSYPLSRLLRFQLHDDLSSLSKTRSFVEFIDSESGNEIAKGQGNWPLADTQKLIMKTRIQSMFGIPKEVVESSCGPAGGVISIAGSSTVWPVAVVWAAVYSSFCDVEITVEGGGSSAGAGRVCGNEDHGSPVLMGSMSREWNKDEAQEQNGFLYECLLGDTTRSAIQVDVAIDGLTVAVAGLGVAQECIEILGGLTTDQLRWIYSNYNDQLLEETGWDPKSVPNSDRNSQTHKWNELHKDCNNIEIRIAGADDLSGTYEYFLEAILVDHDNGETFDVFRPGFSYFNDKDDDILVDYIFTFPEGKPRASRMPKLLFCPTFLTKSISLLSSLAISYFGFSYYYSNQDSLSAVAIQNDAGQFLKPNPETIGDGSYNPLARRIYMNLLNSETALDHTVPFVSFGLQNPEMVGATGYVAIPEDQAAEMIISRLSSGGVFASSGSDKSSGGSGLSTGAIVGIAVGGAVMMCCIFAIVLKLSRDRDSKNGGVEQAH